MSHAILTLVLAAAVAQPNIKPAAKPPSYQEIPLPANAEQLLKSIQTEQTPVPPDLAKEVRDAVERLRAMKPNDLPANFGKREDLQNMAIEYLRTHPDLMQGMKGTQVDAEDVRKFLEKNQLTLPKVDPSIATSPPAIPDQPPPQFPDTPPRTLDQRVGRWLAEWLQDEETGGRFVEMMRDSPAFQDALDDLLRTVKSVDSGWQPTLPDVPGGFDPPKLPGLPKLGLPEVGGGRDWFPKLPPMKLPVFTMPALFDLSNPGLPEMNGDGLQIAIAVVLVVGLLVALRMWARKTAGTAERPRLPAPAAIADGSDLRRAFEVLALNRFGVEAKPWNHNLVAHRLGDGPAARELARLYEKIRYAPGDQPLSEADRESARRSFAELAGGAA